MPTTAVTKGKTVSTDREEPHSDTIFTVPLEQLGRDDLDWAGGKGANLGELVKAGFLVPKGFVVTTDAYDDFVAHNRLDEAITVMLRDEQGSEARAIGSHAAIVAREYGIPAVMGTGDGTHKLSDGQHVRVDGDRGLVFATAVPTTECEEQPG